MPIILKYNNTLTSGPLGLIIGMRMGMGIKRGIGCLAGGILAGAAGNTAAANDFPLAEPSEFVRVCDPYGNAFFYIPGTDTCLRMREEWFET